MRTYSELVKLPTFLERFRYLQLNGKVGEETFGYDRYLNQVFYHSPEWRRIRKQVLMRDNGGDMGIEEYPIHGYIYVHHMNPISLKDIDDRKEDILNPEYLICVSKNTHDAIHYSNEDILIKREPVIRRANDTCPWK